MENLADSIGEALGTDYYGLREPFTPQQEDYLVRTRQFVDNEVLPNINDYWERAEFPWPLIEKLGSLGVVGDGIEGYGCPPMDPLSCGLVHMELHRGDGSLGTFVAVQRGLAMQSIAMHGSEEQKQRWLPGMARLDKIGAFALTEPDHGSDSVALETTARRDGDSYVIDGAKRWIGNGSIADVVVVWARDTSDNQVKGFLVEKGTPGYTATVITGKASMRAVWQAEISLAGVRVPAGNHLPGTGSFKDCARVLTSTRSACLDGARARGRRLRCGAGLCQAAQAVRQVLDQLPARPAAAGQDAGRRHGDAAVLHPDRQARGAGQAEPDACRAGEDAQHEQGTGGAGRCPRPAGWQRGSWPGTTPTS